MSLATDNMVWLEYFGTASGLLYLALEIKQHKAMWLIGLVTSLVYVFVFMFAKIYADMGLQLYYVAISLYGLREWSESPGTISYRHINRNLSIGVTAAILLIFYALWLILDKLTDSPIPIGDAITTSIGIVATWMLAKRIIEHWMLWTVANMISVYIYMLRGLYPTMFLYICYALLAIFGYYNWKKNGIRI